MITLKQTSLGIGNPAVLLLRDTSGGFIVGKTENYPEQIARAWTGADRIEAEFQFQDEVDRMCGRIAA